MEGESDGDALVEGFAVQEERIGAGLGDVPGADPHGLAVQAGQGPVDLLVPLLAGEVLFGGGEFTDQVGGPLDRDVLEDQEVDGYGPRARAVAGRRAGDLSGHRRDGTVPHAHRQRWARCSVTLTVVSGMSRT